jgi:hypothetical protein
MELSVGLLVYFTAFMLGLAIIEWVHSWKRR